MAYLSMGKQQSHWSNPHGYKVGHLLLLQLLQDIYGKLYSNYLQFSLLIND